MPPISNKEKLETIIKHIELEVEQKGEKVGIQELRKHMAYYTKNLKDASKIRNIINTIYTQKELIECLTNAFFE